jgi:hypothetical protein
MKNSTLDVSSSKKRKASGRTEVPSQESVMIVGPTGKTKMIKRPWA